MLYSGKVVQNIQPMAWRYSKLTINILIIINGPQMEQASLMQLLLTETYSKCILPAGRIRLRGH
nr:MAG TPA: hypothetical protein [Caudoviricetes sp.]